MYCISNGLLKEGMRTKSQTNIDRFKKLELLKDEPKYSALTRLLESHIKQMRTGERLPVVRDLMRKFNVSQNTIDRALAKLESHHLITRRWGNGIFVNRNGPPKAARHMIGTVVSDLSDPFCMLLVKGIAQALALQNYHTIICNGHEQFQAELDAIKALQDKIDGVIVYPTTGNVHNPEYVRYFSELSQKQTFPFLLVDILIPGVNAHFVGFDNFNAFSHIAGVIAAGKIKFSQILYLGALGSIIGAERINGFKTGLKEQNISEDLLKIINVRLPVSNLNLAPVDICDKSPTLIVSATPLILPKLQVFCEAHRLRIPEDVVIISVLEENFRNYVRLPVLGLVKPAVKLGEIAAQLIQEIIAGKSTRHVIKIALERFIPKSLRHIF